MIKSKKLIVSSLAIASATLIASQQNGILNNSILGNFTNPVIGFAATNSDWEPHPEYGKVVALDTEFLSPNGSTGFIGTLYEDGTYIMRPVANNTEKLILDNPNGGINTIFHSGENESKIKTFKIEGNIIADRIDISGSGTLPSTINLTGLTLSEKASMPFLSYRDDVLRSITFDPNFSLSHIREVGRMFDRTPNLKLSNEQVSQLLKNVRFESYYGRIFSGVGVERLDLSTFDNSRLKITESVANSGYDHEGHVFKNLIGLNEIVFGDSFSFENYNPKGTKWSFFDTNLSGVKKVTLSGVGTGNHKFIKDWLTDVKKAQLENSDGLYRNGQFVTSVSEALKSGDDKVWESGVYTLGPVLNLNKKEPTVEHKAIPSPVIYEKDETREKGQPNITVNGEPGEEVITTTYSVDPQISTVTPTVGKPVRVKEPTPTKVKVAAKDKVVERNFEPRIRVVADDQKAFGSPNDVSHGTPGVEVLRTTYNVNPTTGEITEDTARSVKTEAGETVVRVGTKPTYVFRSGESAHTNDYYEIVRYELGPDQGVNTKAVPRKSVAGEDTRLYFSKTEDKIEKRAIPPSSTIYEKDETREKGQLNITINGEPGEETVTTSYKYDPELGGRFGGNRELVGKPVRTKEPIPNRVKVAAKDKVVEHELPNRTRYVKDSEKSFGTPNETQTEGHPGREVTRTVYTVNPTDGSITEKTTTTRETEPQDKVIKVGTKRSDHSFKDSEGRNVTETVDYNVDDNGVVIPTTTRTYGNQKEPTEVHKAIPSPIVYEKDDTREKGQPNITVNGELGDEVTITTYSVDPQTGKVTSKTADPVIKKEPTSTKVKVAGKTKVVETEIPYKTTYIEDESVDFGTPNKIQDGVPGKEKTTTTYFVDPKTGEVTSKEEKTKVSDPQNKTVKVGTKPKIEQITESGNLYELKTIYKLNKETGEVTPETTKKFIKKVQIETKEPSVKTPTVKTTPAAKTALNTGVDAATNILPILSLIGMTGGIFLPNRLNKKD